MSDDLKEAARSLIESGAFERLSEKSLKLTTYGAGDMLRMGAALNYLGIQPEYKEDSLIINGHININKLERAGLDLGGGFSKFKDPSEPSIDRGGFKR